MMNLPIRPRRNRKSANIRGLVRETSLSPEHLICPVFVHEGDGNQPISSLPGLHALERAGDWWRRPSA